MMHALGLSKIMILGEIASLTCPWATAGPPPVCAAPQPGPPGSLPSEALPNHMHIFCTDGQTVIADGYEDWEDT